MTDATIRAPRRILLATDFSARCDRALDRAALIATGRGAELIVLHVLEDERTKSGEPGPLPSWRRPADPQHVAERQLRADLANFPPQTTLVVESGVPDDVIVGVAERRDCDVIIVGLARDEPLGRFSLGGTVRGLLRRSNVPVLIVKNRARAPYHDIVVAVDFSDSSRHALETAAQLFEDRELTVLHAYRAPLEGRAGDTATYRRDSRNIAAADYEEFLQGTRLPAGRTLKSLIEWGTPAHLLRDYVEHRDTDLVVLGTHGRGAVFDLLLGSVARDILSQVPCDALVIRRPPTAAAAA
jgi:nucleotide-binding universal stress UspA family protein